MENHFTPLELTMSIFFLFLLSTSLYVAFSLNPKLYFFYHILLYSPLLMLPFLLCSVIVYALLYSVLLLSNNKIYCIFQGLSSWQSHLHTISILSLALKTIRVRKHFV